MISVEEVQMGQREREGDLDNKGRGGRVVVDYALQVADGVHPPLQRVCLPAHEQSNTDAARPQLDSQRHRIWENNVCSVFGEGVMPFDNRGWNCV